MFWFISVHHAVPCLLPVGLDISADTFMERIDTGVVLCKLVSKIQEGIPKSDENKQVRS